jgi:transcriptional regulator with XRE-family HTH domain
MKSTEFNRLKIVLAEQKVTNKELADGLGRTVGTVSKWCTNKMQPTVGNLFEIANFLDVDVRTLLVSNKKV